MMGVSEVGLWGWYSLGTLICGMMAQWPTIEAPNFPRIFLCIPVWCGLRVMRAHHFSFVSIELHLSLSLSV